MHLTYRQTCRVCGSPHLEQLIDLGDQFLQGSFVKEGSANPPLRKIPMRLVRCDVTRNEGACGLLQLAHSVPAEILYANYWYRSGTNQTMRSHLGDIAGSVVKLLPPVNNRVLDIGCNDGTLLGHYPDNYTKFGVDPSDIAMTIKPPATVISSTFPSEELNRVISPGSLSAVTSIAMYYDLEDPVEFARQIRRLLRPDGIWVVEMSYLPMMLKQKSFDTICHEHLEYYSLAVLEGIAARAGMRVFKAVLNDINGGSIRLYLTHADNPAFGDEESAAFLKMLRVREFDLALDTSVPYRKFQQDVEGIRNTLQSMFHEFRRRGERVHVYGASTKGNVLLQWCGLDSSWIECAADRNPDKNGARTLGTNIPIVSEEISRAMAPDYYLVLPWHFKAEFLQREKAAIMAGTKMIFPLPEVSVVSAANFDKALDEARNFKLLDF